MANFEVIIIGGSYAGLSAAMTLGRSLRKALVIDNGKPCNRQTPHSHNFLTQDGITPKEISSIAREQVEKYATIQFHSGFATKGTKVKNGFEVATQSGGKFTAEKLIFATGIKDIMPDIRGIAECWGISVIHCPYCHGYEVKDEKTGILGNGDYGFQFSKKISNWTKDLVLFTNGKSTLTDEQAAKIKKHNIDIIESEIDSLEQVNGKIQNIVFKDGHKTAVKALYAKPDFVQHCNIPESLGCQLTEQGLIEVDELQKTTVPGLFACGDNSSLRSLATAVYTGSIAAVAANHELIDESF